MAGTPGDFTAAQLRDVRIKLADMFGTESLYKHLNRETPIFNGVWGAQSIRFNEGVTMALSNGKHCEGVEALFLQSCDMDVQAATTDCTIPQGTEACVEKVVFNPEEAYEKIVTINEEDCRDEFTFQEKMTLQMANLIAALDQEAERRSIAQLQALADDLTDIEDDIEIGGLNAAKTVWEIPPADWNAELIAEFEAVIEDCEMINVKQVVGRVWRKQLKLAAAKQGDGCCDYDSLFDNIPLVSNTRELDQLVGYPASFLVDTTKIGYFNKWIHQSPTPVDVDPSKNTKHFYVESPKLRYSINGQLRAVRYDIYWQKVCLTEDTFEIRIKGKHRYGFVEMPTNCAGDPFKKVIQISQGPSA